MSIATVGSSSSASISKQPGRVSPKTTGKAGTTQTPTTDMVTFSPMALALSGAASGATAASSLESSSTALGIQQMAKNFTYSTDLPLENIDPMIDGTGPATYDATGQPVTAASQAAFDAEAAQLRQGRISLYQNDMASGVPPKQIMSDLISYMNDNASGGYKTLFDWSRVSGAMSSAVQNMEASAA